MLCQPQQNWMYSYLSSYHKLLEWSIKILIAVWTGSLSLDLVQFLLNPYIKAKSAGSRDEKWNSGCLWGIENEYMAENKRVMHVKMHYNTIGQRRVQNSQKVICLQRRPSWDVLLQSVTKTLDCEAVFKWSWENMSCV